MKYLCTTDALLTLTSNVHKVTALLVRTITPHSQTPDHTSLWGLRTSHTILNLAPFHLVINLIGNVILNKLNEAASFQQ